MASPDDKIKEFVGCIPEPDEIKAKLSLNMREAKMLRQLLRLSEQRERVREAIGA